MINSLARRVILLNPGANITDRQVLAGVSEQLALRDFALALLNTQ